MSQSRQRQPAFTLVEVMMAAVILVIGFVGMIEAVTLSAGMMDHARRQTLATQIINHEIATLRMQSWATIAALPTGSTSLGAAWNASISYSAGDTVTYSGSWYRCISANSGQTPSVGSAYWNADAPPYASILSTSGAAYGATYTLTRSLSTDPVTNYIREVNFTVTWVVTTSRVDSGGSPLTFTFRRNDSAWFGKYGLILSYQRS